MSSTDWDAIPYKGGPTLKSGGSADWDALPYREPQSTPAEPPPARPTAPDPNAPGRVMSFLAGAGRGTGNTVLGIQQLGGKLIAEGGRRAGWDAMRRGGEWLVEDANQGVRNLEAENKPYREANPKSNFAGDLTGMVGGSAVLPMGKLKDGANLVNKLIYGAKVGAIGGAAQAVDPDIAGFWGEKAKQVAIGSAFGAVGVPVASAIGTAVGKATELGRRGYHAVMGHVAEVDPAVAKAIQSSPALQEVVRQATREGKPINPEALAAQARAASLPVPMQLTRGQSTRNVALISNEQNLRAKLPRIGEHLNQQNSQLVENLDEIGRMAAPEGITDSSHAAGQLLLDSLKSVRRVKSDEISTAYRALTEANGGALPMDGTAFGARVGDELGKSMDGAFLPKEIQGIVEQFATGNKPMTFENFENLRTILARAARSSPDGNVRGAVNTVRDVLESMPVSSEVAEVKSLADAARGLFKAEKAREAASPAYQAMVSGRAIPDNFVRKFIIDERSSKAVENLAVSLADDPVALQTIKGGVIAHLRDAAVNKNGFSSARYETALKKLGEKINVLFSPEEVAHLRNLGEVAADVQRAPPANWINRSNSTVISRTQQMVGEGMASGLEAAGNAMGFGKVPIGSIVRGFAQGAAEKRAAETTLREVLSPGAGITGTGQAPSKVLSQGAAKPGGLTFSNFVNRDRGGQP